MPYIFGSQKHLSVTSSYKNNFEEHLTIFFGYKESFSAFERFNGCSRFFIESLTPIENFIVKSVCHGVVTSDCLFVIFHTTFCGLLNKCWHSKDPQGTHSLVSIKHFKRAPLCSRFHLCWTCQERFTYGLHQWPRMQLYLVTKPPGAHSEGLLF